MPCGSAWSRILPRRVAARGARRPPAAGFDARAADRAGHRSRRCLPPHIILPGLVRQLHGHDSRPRDQGPAICRAFHFRVAVLGASGNAAVGAQSGGLARTSAPQRAVAADSIWHRGRLCPRPGDLVGRDRGDAVHHQPQREHAAEADLAEPLPESRSHRCSAEHSGAARHVAGASCSGGTQRRPSSV